MELEGGVSREEEERGGGWWVLLVVVWSRSPVPQLVHQQAAQPGHMLPGLLPLLPLSSVEQPPPHPTLTPTTTTTTLSYPHATTTFSLYHNCYSWKEMYSRLSSVYTCNSKAYWVYCSTFICIIITFLNQTLDFGRLRNLQKNKKRYVWTDDALGDARFKIKTPFLHLKTDSVKKIRLTLNFSVVYGNVLTVFRFQFSFCLILLIYFSFLFSL